MLVHSFLFERQQAVAVVPVPVAPGRGAAAWIATHREPLIGLLHRAGGVLFRGLGLSCDEDLEGLVRAWGDEPLSYDHGSTPRQRVSGGVYTSTEYPAAKSIPLHNEMSYSTRWPRRLWFYVRTAAPIGGETPLADSRRVYARLPVAVRERFERRSVRYVRNYRRDVDLSWQAAFQTERRADVEAFCTRRGIQLEWLSDEHVRTSEVCPAVARHPSTGERVWMNQAHLFHPTSLDPARRELLEEICGAENLPRNAYFGDGTPLCEADLATIRAAYDAERLTFPWREGDVLLLDNLLMSHGRNPFSGPRRVLVAMGGAHDARSDVGRCTAAGALG